MNSFFVQGAIFLRSADGWRLYDRDMKPLSTDAWNDYVPFPMGGGAVQKEELWGIVDHDGHMIVDYQYSMCPEYTSHGIIVGNKTTAREKLLWGMISLDGAELLPMKFDHISPISEGRMAVAFDNKYGYMNSAFQWVIQPQWETAGDFYHHAACVSVGSEISVIDDKGNELIHLPDSSAKRVFLSDGIAVYDENKKAVTLINRRAEVVLVLNNAIIDLEAEATDGLLPIAIINGSQIDYAYLNLNAGEVKTEAMWREVGNYEDGYAIVCDGESERYGVIDTHGDYVIKPIYSSISRIKEVNSIFFEAEIESENAYHYYVYNGFGELVQYIHSITPING